MSAFNSQPRQLRAFKQEWEPCSMCDKVALPSTFDLEMSHRLELLDAGCARDTARFLTVTLAVVSSGCL